MLESCLVRGEEEELIPPLFSCSVAGVKIEKRGFSEYFLFIVLSSRRVTKEKILPPLQGRNSLGATIERNPVAQSCVPNIREGRDEILEKLHHKKNKLDRKLKSVRAWRKVTCIIFASAFASLLICPVVAALVAAPPIAAALTAACSIPLGSMGKWFDSLWKEY
ncbi:UPF0496 protein [Platanthera zijinensis]|uniref:UPF0496 protein n=1 Tax=Platanthera zijinensis TaxID=2320716 RepID=A0AAP0BSH0_9ASPA